MYRKKNINQMKWCIGLIVLACIIVLFTKHSLWIVFALLFSGLVYYLLQPSDTKLYQDLAFCLSNEKTFEVIDEYFDKKLKFAIVLADNIIINPYKLNLNTSISAWVIVNQKEAGNENFSSMEYRYIPLIAKMNIRGVLIVEKNKIDFEEYMNIISITFERIFYQKIIDQYQVKDSSTNSSQVFDNLNKEIKQSLNNIMDLAKVLRPNLTKHDEITNNIYLKARQIDQNLENYFYLGHLDKIEARKIDINLIDFLSTFNIDVSGENITIESDKKLLTKVIDNIVLKIMSNSYTCLSVNIYKADNTYIDILTDANIHIKLNKDFEIVDDLSLEISNKIMQKLGGGIDISSTNIGGTLFSVYIK